MTERVRNERESIRRRQIDKLTQRQYELMKSEPGIKQPNSVSNSIDNNIMTIIDDNNNKVAEHSTNRVCIQHYTSLS